MKSFFVGVGSAAALPAVTLLSGCAAAPPNGTVDAGGSKMMNGRPKYECGAQVSFGPAAADSAQACILHWSGDLFLVQQGASTDCDFSEDTGGITFYYRQ